MRKELSYKKIVHGIKSLDPKIEIDDVMKKVDDHLIDQLQVIDC